MDTSRQGKIGECRFILEFLKKGYQVFLPVDDHALEDMVVDIDGVLKRVQIKSVTPRRGVLAVKNRSCNALGTTNNWYDGKIDLFGVYDIANDRGYLVPMELIPANSLSLRIDEPQRRYRKIHYAKDYIFF